MAAWIGIVGTLIGVLLGGVVAWFNARFQLRYQENRDRKKLILERLEELYQLLSQYNRAYFNMLQGHIYDSIDQNFSPIIPPELMPKPPEQEEMPVPIERLQMLIGFYAPELDDHLKKLEGISEEYGDFLIKVIAKQALEEDKEGPDLKALYTQHEPLNKIIEEMQAEVVKLSKNYL
jgi:hypothetical protein